MKPIRLYIQDFMCYSSGFIDFTSFNSALIVGKVSNNELYSNGVGKTTIFKSIEYVLFNQSEFNIENVIREDAKSCKIIFDFMIDDQEYRLSRSRNKKGVTDLSLLKRNSVVGLDNEVYHDSCNIPITDDTLIKKYWQDISGRRVADTEKELFKLLKINFKTFQNTYHFIQNDISGLSTTTSDKRKTILKDILSLGVYVHLEKLAKSRASIINKEIDKCNILISNIGDPSESINNLNDELNNLIVKYNSIQVELINNKKIYDDLTEELNCLSNLYTTCKSKFSSLLESQKNKSYELSKIKDNIIEYQSKKDQVVKSAQSLVNELSSLKENLEKLNETNFDLIEEYSNQIISKKEEIAKNNIIIQNNMIEYEDLKIPFPSDAICKHCRQKLTIEHKQICKQKVDEDIKKCQLNISESKKNISELNKQVSQLQQKINDLNQTKQKINDLNTKIAVKSKDLQDKKSRHTEYKTLLNTFNCSLLEKQSELDHINEELKNSSIEESNELKNKIDFKKEEISKLSIKINSLNKESLHINNSKVVVTHNLNQKQQEVNKKEELLKKLKENEDKYKLYPEVIQAFSSLGISNLIIQNVLDDLQIEANNLLNQLKPGLQLTFTVEKTKDDGTQEDKLDIHYTMHGKPRHFNQLSGAMKLAVTFSLKLGLSFMLQKILGTNIQLLLLDEIDQSLDKASIDAFADIVKFFSKDFTILVITHNDRMKDKFSHAVLVDQNINMVSTAKVVTSW